MSRSLAEWGRFGVGGDSRQNVRKMLEGKELGVFQLRRSITLEIRRLLKNTAESSCSLLFNTWG